jgi:tetratricopeptide (TPR) repeat protein
LYAKELFQRGGNLNQVKEMKVDEFVRRLKTLVTHNDDSKFVFFLGAGCSISSGIPGAAKLVRGWLPRLKEMKTGKEDNYESWAKELYSDYTEENASLFYGKVIEDLFLTSEERQREIERLTEGKDPAFGYAVLAQLITHQECGSHCNVVLTVNFDDFIADALYLYTQKKPLVISHESLAGFVRITRTRPLIIKLHGDARLEPKNTELETKELDEAVRTVLKSLLCEMGLIFIGYGGHDESIAEMLDELPANALPWGVYWIGSKKPGGKIGAWLELRNAVWVNHKDFDELMLLILNEFGLNHPRKDRFDRLMDTYFETFRKLKDRIEAQLKKEEVEMLREALNKAIKEFGSWWGVVLEAEKYEKNDPEKADIIYQEGLKKFPTDVNLLGSYAYFLHFVRKNYDKAEEYYRKALERDPDHAFNLGNYASFLDDIRKDYDKAEEYYRKALERDPDDATNLGNYAIFLHDIRKDYDKAEEYYRKALERDPDDANHLGNYASFLYKIRKDYDKAEEYYRKALERDPDDANNLGNYASFLDDIRKDYDKAEEYYRKALERDPDHANNLGNYAIFLDDIRKDYDKAEEYYRKALERDPDDAFNLGNYASFLKNIRKDYDKAEEYYRKALERDPDHADNLGNYAGFLLSRGNEEGFSFLEKALYLARDQSHTTLLLECLFYQYAHSKDEHSQKESLKEIKSLLQEGIRSPGWDLSSNVERATKDGHPHPDFLNKLAGVISEEIDIKELDNFKLWQDA